MPYRPSLSQIRSQARARAAQLQFRARQAAQDNQRRVEQQVRAITGNGTRPLSRAQAEQIARDSVRYLRNRLK
jgi:hypothetical protein